MTASRDIFEPQSIPAARAGFWISPARLGVHRAAFVVFLAGFATTEFAACFHAPEVNILLALAALTTFAGVARFHPLQNIITVAILLAAAAGALEWLRLEAGLAAQMKWSALLYWPVLALNSRGTAKLMLEEVRHAATPGLRLIAIAAVLSTAFIAGEDFRGWTPLGLDAAAAAALLLLAAPWLINKRPAPLPRDPHPLWVWLLLDAHFTAANARMHLWPAVMLGVVSSAIVFSLSRSRGRQA